MTDVLILGAGPAGLTAAIYAARAGLSVIVFDKTMYGGQTILTSEVDNYPGMQGVEGVDFATRLHEHAVSQGAQVRLEEIVAVQLDGPVKRLTTREKVYEGRTVILAGGTQHRKMGVPGEEEYLGRGVSFCATCDGGFFAGKDVAVVGGGDTALTEALYLSNLCKTVYVIHRRDSFRAAQVKQDALRGKQNIEPVLDSLVSYIQGKEHIESILVETPGGPRSIPVSAVFVAIGLSPETSLYKGLLPMTAEGYVLAGEDCRTPLPGVYVAGDVREKPLRQIVTAAADGAVAAVAAAEYLHSADEHLWGV